MENINCDLQVIYSGFRVKEGNTPRNVKRFLARDMTWGTGTIDLLAAKKTCEISGREPWKKYEPSITNLVTGASTDEKFAINFPENHFNFESEGINHFIATVAGDSITNRAIENIEVSDFEIDTSCNPNSKNENKWKKIFPGPKFGVDGLYGLCGVKDDRPLLAFSIKPRIGLDTNQYEKVCAEALEGGADIVEEDERLIDPFNCRFSERVKVIKKLIGEQIDNQKKNINSKSRRNATQFSVNITGPEEIAKKRLNEAYEAGIRMVKVDVMVVGFDVLRNIAKLAHSKADPVAVTVYPDVYGKNYRKLSRSFILKMCRYCGADIIYAGTPSFSRYEQSSDIGPLEDELAKIFSMHRILQKEVQLGKNPMLDSLPTITNDTNASYAEAITILFKAFHNHHRFAFFVGGGISGYPDASIKTAVEDFRSCIENASKFELSGSYTPYKFSDTRHKGFINQGWNILDIRSIINDIKADYN